MDVIHAFTNIGLPIALLRVLKPHDESLYFGYLGAAIAATVLLVVGVVFLLLLLPLSDAHVAGAESLALLLRKGNFFSYQLGMVIWSLGGLVLCRILHRAKLVPRFLTVWGAAGYAVFMCGCILEMFGHNVGVPLSAPGGFFEIALSLWLIVKGFRIIPPSPPLSS